MTQDFGVLDHEHISDPEARFTDYTKICTTCIGRAFLMAVVRPNEPVSSEAVNTALDRARIQASAGSGGSAVGTPAPLKFGEAVFHHEPLFPTFPELEMPEKHVTVEKRNVGESLLDEDGKPVHEARVCGLADCSDEHDWVDGTGATWERYSCPGPVAA